MHESHNLRPSLLAIIAISISLLAQGARADGGPNVSNIKQGKRIAFSRTLGNCLECHRIDDGALPGNIGPPLSNMRHRFPNKKALYQEIYDATKSNPNTIMPPFGRNHILTPTEINQVIAYLYTL